MCIGMVRGGREKNNIRATVTLDDEIVEQLGELIGVRERGRLLREALSALIQRENARRPARLGGSEPQLEEPPRRPQPA